MEENKKQEKRSPALAIPVLAWLGKIVAGWVVSKWITYMWNKYVKKENNNE